MKMKTTVEDTSYCYEKGDRVVISTKSGFFKTQGMHGTGTVISRETIHGCYLRVRFDDGYENTYSDLDLTFRGAKPKGD